MECEICKGEKWVCENHQDKPWNSFGCTCGAGAPCFGCNPLNSKNHEHKWVEFKTDSEYFIRCSQCGHDNEGEGRIRNETL